MHDSLKKSISTAVATATMLWSVGAASFVAPLTARAAMAGDVIRGTTLSTLYYQGNDGKRYAFPNEKTYLSWYADFSGVQKISDSALAAIPLGGNVAYRPGARWIKIQSDPKTYAVAPNGALRWIESESVASGLAGSDWNQFIDDVADVFFVDYTVGASLTSAANAYNGALVKAADGTYYVVQNGAKRKVTSAGFSANRLQSRLALDGSGVNLSAMTSGSDVTGKEAWLSDAAQLPEQAIGGGLSVSLASDSPAAMTVPSQATSVAFMKFNLSASGATTVSSITIKQGGVGATSTVSNVYLYDGNKRLTDARSINSSSREATFGSLNMALSAGQTKTLAVVVDMSDNGTGGDTISFEIASASSVVGASTVSGSFPIKGATMTTSSTDVGSLTVAKSGSIVDPTIGAKQAIIGEFKLTATSTEGAKLHRIRLDVNDASSHNNYNLYQNGTLVAVGTRADSEKVDFLFTNPFEISSGSNKIFQLKADIGGENNEDISVAVEETTDVYAVGTKYGFGVEVDTGANSGSGTYNTTNCTASSSNCSFSEVQGGKLTVAFNGPTASKFKQDQTGLVLMDLTVTNQNDVQVRALGFTVAGTDLCATGTGPCTIANYENFRLVNKASGQAVSGPVEMVASSDTAAAITFPDDFSMQAGQSLDLQLLVDAKGTDDPYTIDGDESITATMDVSEISARDSNNDTLTIANGDIVPGADLAGNAMTSQVASLTVTLAQPPSSSTVVRGAQAVDAVAFSFVAGAASSVKTSAITFNVLGDNDITADGTWQDDLTEADEITSCSIYDTANGGLISGPVSVSSSSTAVFTGFNWTVPAGETRKMLLRCNLANIDPSSDGSSLVFFLEQASDITAADSEGDTITVGTIADADGNDPTGTESVLIDIVRSGTLAFAVAGDTPDSMIVLANSTGVTVSKFKVTASRESFLIKKLTVWSDDQDTLSGVSSVMLEYQDQAGVTKTASGSLTDVGSNGEVIFSNLSLYAPKDTPVTFSVKVTTGDATTENTASGDAVDLELHMDESADDQFEAIGLSSGATLDDDAETDAATSGFTGEDGSSANIYLNTGKTHTFRKTKPTVSLASGSPSGAGVPGLKEVFKFNISADSRGAVGLKSVSFQISATPATAATNNWNDCDAGDLGAQAKWALYDSATPATELAGTWVWIDGDATDGCTANENANYAMLPLTTELDIAAGATKTFSLEIDTLAASTANDDAIQVSIPTQAAITALDDATITTALVWDDANLTNGDAVDITGLLIANLPVRGGTVVY